MTDEDLYLAAGDLVLEARYADALPLLFRIRDRNNPQVLNLIGYSTRKLGDVDKGIDYYHRALVIDPNYTKARQYLGEASAEGRRGEGERAAHGDRRPLRRPLRRLRASGQGDRRARNRRGEYRLAVLSRGFLLDAMHVGVGKAEMMADLMHQHMGDDVP